MNSGAWFATAAVAVALCAPAVSSAAPEKRPPAKKPVVAKSSVKAKPVKKSRKPAAAVAAAAVPAAAVAAEPLSDVQLVLATMVQVGRADCEFQQTVWVEPNLRQLGGFVVKFEKAAYTMVPEQTTTGAIRLVDPKAGVAWLQIRYKSMLMNTRAGQRMVDACSMPAQRLAEADAERLVRAAAENGVAPGEAGNGAPREEPLLKN